MSEIPEGRFELCFDGRPIANGADLGNALRQALQRYMGRALQHMREASKSNLEMATEAVLMHLNSTLLQLRLDDQRIYTSAGFTFLFTLEAAEMEQINKTLHQAIETYQASTVFNVEIFAPIITLIEVKYEEQKSVMEQKRDAMEAVILRAQTYMAVCARIDLELKERMAEGPSTLDEEIFEALKAAFGGNAIEAYRWMANTYAYDQDHSIPELALEAMERAFALDTANYDTARSYIELLLRFPELEQAVTILSRFTGTDIEDNTSLAGLIQNGKPAETRINLDIDIEGLLGPDAELDGIPPVPEFFSSDGEAIGSFSDLIMAFESIMDQHDDETVIAVLDGLMALLVENEVVSSEGEIMLGTDFVITNVVRDQMNEWVQEIIEAVEKASTHGGKEIPDPCQTSQFNELYSFIIRQLNRGLSEKV